MKRIPELDGLRGTAICMVVAHHYIYYKYLSFLGPQWGWAGVDLFFVLSGFLITGILLKSEKNEEGLGHFYMRRVMRLFPIYYLCLAIYFIGNVAAHSPLPWQFLATYSLYLQAIVPHSWLGIEHVKMVDWSTPGFSVMWSLSIEEFFYLVWAPLVFLVRGKDRILFPLLGVVLLGEPFVRFFAYSHHAEELRQMFFARRFTCRWRIDRCLHEELWTAGPRILPAKLHGDAVFRVLFIHGCDWRRAALHRSS